MKKTSLIWMVALAYSLAACGMPKLENRVALVFGVSEYLHVSDVSHTDDDAIEMAELLNNQGWTVEEFIDNGWTKEDMREAIYDNRNNPGLLLIYFAGHGHILNGTSFICPLDTVANNPETMVSGDELLGWLKDAGLDHSIVILDSCRSGGFAENGITVDGIRTKLYSGASYYKYHYFRNAGSDAVDAWLLNSQIGNTIVLAAAGKNEDSYTWGEKQNGAFTWFLLEAVKNADYDRNGWISTGELYDYAARGIITQWNTKYRGLEFHPHISGQPIEYMVFKRERN